MEVPTIQDLVRLPEEEAARQRFSGEDHRNLRYLSLACGLVAFVFLLYELLDGDYWGLVLPVLTIGLARVVFSAYDWPWFRAGFDWLLPLAIVAHLALLLFMIPSRDQGFRVVWVVGIAVMLSFRLSTRAFVLLYAVVWAGTLAWPLYRDYAAGEPLLSPRLLVQTAAIAAGLYFSITGTARARKRFQRDFRIEASRNRERLRMRQELDSARQIQLSMLPRRDPKVNGLEIASVSLPANEVGGDYYEYFPEDDSRLVVVVGDVAGHGLASGLMLSGLRSCLYLLEPDRLAPLQILERLNLMVRRTTDRRMFITLLYASIDPAGRRLLVSAAGHPPLLHHRRGATVIEELGQPAPPLGTGLDTSYCEVDKSLESGDLLVIYTDGLTETVNIKGEVYGDQRLRDRLLRVVSGHRSVRDIREALLADVWTWKGDAEQQDDITLVVIRVE